MSTTTINRTDRPLGTDVPRGIGLPGRVAVTWATAGGLLLGGFLVAGMTLSGRLSGSGLFFTSSGLFVIGVALGLLHGGVLGFLGRTGTMTVGEAGGALARSALYTIPAVAVAWLATVWIAMTVVALYMGRALPLFGVAVSWGVGLALLGSAGIYGWRALRNAFAEWPERRIGTATVGMTFAALLTLFLADRPELWGLPFRVTEIGAVLLAGALSIWVAGPAVTVALRLLRGIRAARPVTARGHGRVWADAGLGVLVGLVLGVLAIPFAGTAVVTATGPAGAVVTALSQAVVDEVLLRLVLLSSVVWMLLRWQRVRPMEAVGAAILLTALIQVALYTPGVLAIGFPSGVTATGFLLVTVLLPALAFGTLYWMRGFGSALAADATAMVAIALLAL